MKRRILFGVLVTVLGVNLFFGAQLYTATAHASQKDDPYENYKLLADVLEKVRQEYVDGDKLTYQDLIHAALKGMIASLDPHSEFMDAEKYDELKKDTEGEFGGLGIVVEMSKDNVLTVVEPMDGSPSLRAGIMPRDQIIKIEGKSVGRIGVDEAVKTLRGEPGTTVTITIRRPSTGEIKDIPLTRADIHVDTVKDINDKRDFKLGHDGIGYVRILQFGEKTSDELDDALQKLRHQGMKALIIDLRNNPGGLLDEAGHVCEKFLPRGQLIVSTEGRGPTPRSEYRADYPGKRFNLPMVVLVNGYSASAAEIVSGCLQDLQPITHAIILGEQTFGKGSVQSILPLSDGSALRLTTAKYYTPSHKVIHEHGITPDIYVPMSRQDESDLQYKQSPGALEALDAADRARIEKVEDKQLDRAEELLKGILLYSERGSAVAGRRASLDAAKPIRP